MPLIAKGRCLLRIGDGRQPVETDLGEDIIKLPADMCAESDDSAALLDTVFRTYVDMFNQPAFMVGRGVLTPKNADIDDVNAKALQRFPGQVCFQARACSCPVP